MTEKVASLDVPDGMQVDHVKAPTQMVCGTLHRNDEANARFIAAANPAAVLDLLAENEALLARVAETQGDAQEAVNGAGGWRDVLKVETILRERAEADVATLRKNLADAQADNAANADEAARIKEEIRAALNKHRFTGKTPEAAAVNEVLVSIARDLHIAHEDT